MPTTPPIPVLMLANFVLSILGYFGIVGLLYQVVWRWGRKRFQTARIPAPQRVDGRQIRREVGQTVVSLVAGAVTAGAVGGLQFAGLAQLQLEAVSPLETLAWVAGGLVINDAWFYGWHRLLHHPKLFRFVHHVHHRSIDVNPFTSYSFHGVEAILLGLWIVPAVVLLPIPMASLAALQVIGLANNVMSHLGYEFLPRWILKVPLLRWTNTATFHSLHHTRSRGNFGLHMRFWDRLFGTELPEYEQVFVDRGCGKQTREPSNQQEEV
jgi:sterol desaturase/sphingolipid hydroxylase (fatty acid hydroxylase superfamily)